MSEVDYIQASIEYRRAIDEAIGAYQLVSSLMVPLSGIVLISAVAGCGASLLVGALLAAVPIVALQVRAWRLDAKACSMRPIE